MVNRLARRSCRNRWRNSSSTSGSSSTTRMSRLMPVLPISVSECGRTRQNNADLSVLAGLAVDLYKPGMLLDDDVMTDRQTEASAFTGWLRREERIEHLVPYV